MWLPRGGGGSNYSHNNDHNMMTGGGGSSGGGVAGVVAVAINKDKGSQNALKWAIDNLLPHGQPLVLIHVQPLHHHHHHHHHPGPPKGQQQIQMDDYDDDDGQTKELFLTFHCYCTRKDIQCVDIVLQDTDVAKALSEYVSYAAIPYLVLGAPSRHGFIRRFKSSDVPSHVIKGAPDFCTVYVISKSGKISSARNSSRPAPFVSPLHDQFQDLYNSQSSLALPDHAQHSKHSFSTKAAERTPRKPHKMHHEYEVNKHRSPSTTRTRGLSVNFWDENLSESDSDISFVSSGRPSTDISFASSSRPSTDRVSSTLFDDLDYSGRTSRVSTSSDQSFGSKGFSSSFENGRTSSSSQNTDDVEAEMRRLKLELQKTMELYSTACREALTTKQKAVELQRWRIEEEQRLEEARLAEEAARAVAEKERAKLRAEMEIAEASQTITDMEVHRRIIAEMNDHKLDTSEERQKEPQKDVRYRKYTIDEIEEATEFFAESRKIGEGGYGPVFKCALDHTPVAVKVLRPDAAQGMSQFQQEVEVLSCMRHPNMVLLVGACPEYGCLVYEYMANGSLEDRLQRKGNTPALSWQQRFRIAAEVGTGIHFLHQTKPEPIVHRDLKPANILLDKNYVSKISDVGLARLVPPSVVDEVTQYRMTSTAGTFCYIDPEYQQTGMLGVKSDVYSLGIMLLQIITAKPAMGLTHSVGRSIEKGTFAEMLDQSVPDWPGEEALSFAKLALKCAELRRKDRPDLGKVVLPELNRLRALAEDSMQTGGH